MILETLPIFLITWIILIISGSFHEYGHACSAYFKGDITATVRGRKTLNPLKHIDFMGTLLVPVIFGFMTGFVWFAWMKPVPIDLRQFKNPRVDQALVTAFGPLSNFMLMLAGFFVIALFFPEAEMQGFSQTANILIFSNVSETQNILLNLVYFFTIVNAILGFFNLIPVAPLDGSWILISAVPKQYQDKLRTFLRIGPFLLLFLIFSGAIHPLFQWLFSPDLLSFFQQSLLIPLSGMLLIALFYYGWIVRPYQMDLKDDIKSREKQYHSQKNTNEQQSSPFQKNDKYTHKAPNLMSVENILTTSKDKEEIQVEQDQNKKLYQEMQGVLEELKSGKPITSELKTKVIELAKKVDKEANICTPEQFGEQDQVCLQCEYYKNCLLRELTHYMKKIS